MNTKKMFITMSVAALFAGAATAADPEFIGGGRTVDDVSSVENTLSSGTYGNVAGGTGGVQNGNINSNGAVNGDVLLNLENVKITGWIITGNTANSHFDADNDYLKGISGKNILNFNAGTVLDNTGVVSSSAGLRGGLSGAYTHATVGSIELNLNGGEIKNSFVFAAGGNGSANILGDVVVNARGTNIAGYNYSAYNMGVLAIAGFQGCLDPIDPTYGFGADDRGDSVSSYIGGRIKGALRINVSAGEINGNIWGAVADARIDGGTHINLSGDAVVNGDVNLGVGAYNAYIGASDATLTGNAVVNGTIYGQMKADSRAKERYMESATLNIGTVSEAYNGTQTLKVSNFDEINVAKGSTASVGNLEYNLTGAIAGSRNNVKEGAKFTVEGDIVNNLVDATNNASFVAGLTSQKVDQQSAGSAIVKGTVKTVIDGENTKLKYVYGGNGGNQKGVLPHLRAMMESSVGAVDLTINNGSMDMVVASGAMFSDVAGNIDVKVNGGTIGGIYGVASDANVGGDVNIIVNGGKFVGDVTNGYTVAISAGGANNGDSDISASTISGSTNIVLGGNTDIHGDIYGGGWGAVYGGNVKQGGLIKGDTNITVKGDVAIDGTIYGGGVEGKTAIEGSKNLNIGTSEEAYNGGTLKVRDFDVVSVKGGTNAVIEGLEFNQTGTVSCGVLVADGSSLTVQNDIVRNYNDITTSGDTLVAGIDGGNATVIGTVKTVIDGENTKLKKFYGGNGGNQKRGEYVYDGKTYTDAIPKGVSTVGAVDITVNNGTIEYFVLGSGAMHSDVLGNVDIKINGGYVDDIFGGATGANIGGDVNITVMGGTVGGIAAGSRGSGEGIREDGVVGGSTNIVIGGNAVITRDVYGGGWGESERSRDTVNGNTNITLQDSAKVAGTLYGGSWSSTASILGTKNLNIGTETNAYNGSTIKVADFQKIGVVNGSVEISSYTQAAEGTLITVFEKGKLAMSLNSESQFSNTSIENAGELAFKRGKLADNASVALKSYNGSGKVSAFGGTFADGVFTAGKSAAFGSSAITVGTGANDVQTVKFGDKLALDFNVAGLGEAALTVNAIKASTELNGIAGNVLAAFDVDLSDNGNDYTVVFSAYVGAIEDTSTLVAWHKGKDGVWTRLDTAIDYADEIASIVVDGFSSYAFSQVPEPATYAAIFGAVVLAFAAYRRRR